VLAAGKSAFCKSENRSITHVISIRDVACVRAHCLGWAVWLQTVALEKEDIRPPRQRLFRLAVIGSLAGNRNPTSTMIPAIVEAQRREHNDDDRQQEPRIWLRRPSEQPNFNDRSGIPCVKNGPTGYTRMPLARIASASSAAGPCMVLPVPSRTNSTAPRSGKP
jgi:hypothetical protein